MKTPQKVREYIARIEEFKSEIRNVCENYGIRLSAEIYNSKVCINMGAQGTLSEIRKTIVGNSIVTFQTYRQFYDMTRNLCNLHTSLDINKFMKLYEDIYERYSNES